MFKNAERDPLGIPARAPRRMSQGPTHRDLTPRVAPAPRLASAPVPTPREPVTAPELPRRVAKVLDREARAFMEREGNTDDRSELLYRARRHASTLTSTWSRDASEKVTQAFCGRVAALIPSRPRVAAAQTVTEFADFDDSLLY